MKIASQPHPLTFNDERRLAPILVGMHVLGPARTDVRVMRAATTLAAVGCRVHVIDLADTEHTAVETVRDIQIEHIVVPHSFFATRFERRTLFRTARLFLQSVTHLLRIPADVYHAHDVSALPACYLAALLRRKPLIFETHEMPLFERPLAELSHTRRFLHRILTLLLLYVIPRCAGVIAVSPPIVEEIRRRYHISEVILLRNLPEYRVVARNKHIHEHLHFTPETRIVLYQGNLQPNRELDRLVRAARFLEPDTIIVLMGKDVRGTVWQLEELIISEGMQERVFILPPVPYAELLTWTASADLGLAIYSPDYSLNVSMFLPNKLFEYLLAGTPVLASRIGPIVEIIEHYQVGRIVESLEPSEIGAAINKMLADTDALASMSHRALNAAREDLCWEKESPKLLCLYQKIFPTNRRE